MSKILKIILSIVAAILVIFGILYAILYVTGTIILNKQANSIGSGWDRKVLKGDLFETFFPRTLGKNLYYIGPYQGGKIDSLGPLGDIKNIDLIEYNDNSTIDRGTDKFYILAARRSFYANKTLEEIPVFKMWAELLSSEDFIKYKKDIVEKELKSYSTVPGVTLEKAEYKNHEYYIYLRDDLSYEGLKGKNSIGGAYVFFPEKNISLYILLFNTKYNTPDAYLISKKELVNVIQEIVDSSIK